MRELTVSEAGAVQGGIVPLLIAGAAVLALSGCSTVGGLRRGERPADPIPDKP